MTHAEFVAGYARGEIRIEIDPPGAARYLSTRLLLPFVMLPVLGVGIALALVGWIVAGLAVIAAGIIVPRLIKRSAPHILFQNALEDERIYEELRRVNVLRVTEIRER
jgi:hypothetical protein